MAFQVVYSEGPLETFSDEDDTFWFNEHGLLVIDRADGTITTLAPQAWKSVSQLPED